MDLKQYTNDAIRTEANIETVEVNELLLTSVMQQMIHLGALLDMMKKNVFYGKEYKASDFAARVDMTADANNTMNTISFDELQQSRKLDINPRLFHGIVGMMTEAVELMEGMRLYDDDWDATNLLEEIGDSSWYQAILIDELGGNWDDILNRNIEKLKARYPDKFDTERAITRDLDTERAILDQQQQNG